MKTILVCILMMLISSFSFSQGLRVAPVLGLNATFTALSKPTKDFYNNTFYELIGGTGSTSFPTPVRLLAGSLVDYEANDILGIQSGLIFNLRGFYFNVKGELTDSYGQTQMFSAKVKTRFTYLEIPIWATVKLGESGFKLIAGPNFGFAIGGRSISKMTLGDLSESTSEAIEVGNDPGSDTVKPFDLNLNLAIAKEVSLANSNLELSLFVQPSITKWNPTSTVNSEYSSRHITAGIRAAYLFSIAR